jgi:hypothetical protein
MRFKIAIHSGHKAPSHALDELLRGLGGRRGELTFLRRGSTIAVTCHEADGDSETRLVRAEARRCAVFEEVCLVCERVPDLRSDWFAVATG